MPTGLVRKSEAGGRAVIRIKQAKLNAPPTVISGVQMNWLVDEPN